jgi:hypothetical protein
LSEKLIKEAENRKDQEQAKIVEKLMNDLQNRIEKVLTLEMDLDMH